MALDLLPGLNKGASKTSINKPYTGNPVTETLTNGFFTVDRKWVVKYWNKSAEKLLGVAAGDIIGKNLWEKFAGTIPLEFYAVYNKAFLKETPLHFEEYWGEMGAWFDVVTYYSDDTLAVSFKSSNLPHAEYPESPVRRLNTLTELYKFVTEITNDCLWEWDMINNELFWIDGGHKRVFGYQIENALIPRSFWENSIHPDDKDRILARLNRITSEGTVSMWEDEYRFKKADGTYVYVHDRGHIVYDNNNIALRMIGATQDITEKVLLGKKLMDERETRSLTITEAVLTAQENERAEIGKELHDNLNQVLAVAKMYIQMAGKKENYRSMYLERSGGLIEKVMEDIRRIAKNLVIPDIKVSSLSDNIKNLLHELRIHPLKIEFHNDDTGQENFSAKLQLTIFRIVQEQLNNVLKHAHATLASIHLSIKGEEIHLLIKDNGNGYDTSTENKGVGLINIKSRAEFYHGKVTVLSKPGQGYELKVILPLEKSE